MAAETIIQIRRGNAATWTTLNPTLSAGEMGLESDTRKVKIGDGTTPWVSLSYSVGQVGNINFSGNTISSTDSNGDLTLDPNGTGDVYVADTADLYVGGLIYTNSKEVATKEYVDSVKQGLDVKNSVRVATTVAVNLSTELENGDTVDGVTLATGDRVLVKNQEVDSENGIYVVKASGAPDRADDANSNDDVTAGMFTFVEEGTANGDSGWVLTTNGSITLDTTGLAFSQFSGAGQVTAGAGMSKTGNTLDVGTADVTRIVVNADNIDLAQTGVVASTYKSVTVDAYGRVTAGTNPTTLSGYGINDAQGLDATLTALAGLSTSADQMVYSTGADAFAMTSLTSFARTLLDDADAAAARTTLGLVIGTDVQAYDAELAALAGVTSAADALPYFTGTGTASTTTMTSFARTLLDDADAAAMRVTLGISAIADATIEALAGLTTSADQMIYSTGSDAFAMTSLTSFARTLLDDADASTARTTLGLVIGTDVQAYNSTLDAVAGGTYTGDDSIVTVGTIGTGTWQGTTVATGYGGTGLTSYVSGDIIYASATDTLSALAKGTGYQFLKMNSAGTAPEWSSSLDGGTP